MRTKRTQTARWYRTSSGQVLLASLGVAGVYLLTQHWAHAVAYLPWLLLLACPLMHGFMHGSHGGHGGHGGTGPRRQGD